MKTPKLSKGIAGKFINKKGSQIAATTANIEDPRIHDMPEDVEVKEQTNASRANYVKISI